MERKYTNIKERVLYLAENKGISKEAFLDGIGMTYGSFKGKAKEGSLNSDAIAKISTIYPEVNLNWLLNGTGDVYTNQGSSLKEPDIEYAPQGKFPKKKGYGKVAFYDIDFIAGDLDSINDQSIKPAHYMDIPEFAGCTAFRTYNDSMEGLIKSGMILFGEKINNWFEHLEYGQIYGIVCNDGRRYLKYIRKHKDTPDKYFLLKSENSEMYDDFDLPKKSIKSIWLIHGWFTKRV